MITDELFQGSSLDEELTRIQGELNVIQRRIEPQKPTSSYLAAWFWAIAIYGAMGYLFWKMAVEMFD
jgi:hypothetical protein